MGRNRWRRFRGYVDELEEIMRILGAELDAAEAEIAREYKPCDWPRKHRVAARRELVRRALDVPFFDELVRDAASCGDLDALTPPDEALRPWDEGQDHVVKPPGPRAGAVDDSEPLEDGDGGPAPARLRHAERALAHRTRSLVPLLEDLTAARNASAVVRTADALGLQEVHFVHRDGKIRLQTTVTTSCQRYLDLHWHRDTSAAIAGLRERGYRILCADFGAGATSVEDVPLGERVALLFGSEQRGVSARARDEADALFYVPTCGFASYLNVSVAAGIALATVDRRLRTLGARAPLDEADRDALRRAWYLALAGDDPERQRLYLAWAEKPPAPSPLLHATPSREKRR